MSKTAIITGGASGIGLAIAGTFVKNKIRTIVIGRDENKLAAAKEQLGALCETVRYDLNEIGGIPKLVEELCNRFQQIDILVNNAGINLKKNLLK